MSTKRPKVSVCIVTYNQREYISQCIQSILDQRVNFDFEVVVSDDCSTDGAREVISEFSTRFPETIKPIFHERNVGPYQNCMFAHAKATGEYIAHLDGDDYALPGKLQAQADKLDSDAACTMVWHRMRILDARTGVVCDDRIDPMWSGRRAFSRCDLLALMAVGLHSSTMYRATHRDFPVPPFDTMDYLMKAERIGTGRGYFVGEGPLGVYRSGIGIASRGSYTKLLLARSMEYLARRFPEQRAAINTGALIMVLAELKNRGDTLPRFWRAWRTTFHVCSPWLLARYWRDVGKLKLPVRS